MVIIMFIAYSTLILTSDPYISFGLVVFFAIFLVTLLKEGVFPLKQKISAFLNFDQAGIIQK